MAIAEILLEPRVDEWEEYLLPNLVSSQILVICRDILDKLDSTQYQAIYDMIYEVVEAEIDQEAFNGN